MTKKDADTAAEMTGGAVPGLKGRGDESAPSRSEIARVAFELYLSRGRTDGGDVADWLEAERMLRGRR